MSQASSDSIRVYTIGHSNHEEQVFVQLLRQHGIQVVADVRSQPYSRHTPHFNADQFETWLSAAGTDYVFFGQQLGGRPDNASYYDADGHVLYNLVAASQSFQDGIECLLQEIQRHRVALLCSEENPAECHRNLLVARVLSGRGVEPLHVRGDGRLQTQAELERESCKGDPRQQVLFDAMEEQPWRSIRSVLQKPGPPNSSAS